MDEEPEPTELRDIRDVQPTAFRQIIGQDHVKKALEIAVEASFAEQKRLDAEEARRLEAQERLARKQATQTAPDAIIKELSRDSDLKVSTLASQAKRAVEMRDDGEVVISLH